MKQGNGTEILGPNDPRAASIGIIHVSPTDERKNVLVAIITQEKFGRKQVAVVLPPHSRAFQRPADFDDLKSMCNRLKTEVVFIAPHGPGPGEFARQRRFPVYSSLETYAQAVRAEDLVGQQLGRYRLTLQLTRGGFSNIYLGEHIDLGIKVAIKVLINSIDRVTFQSGVRRISRLTHPNIVRVTDSGIKDGIPFLVMDYAPKGSLHDRHSRLGTTKLPLATVVDYVKQIAAALQEIHDHNIVLGYVHPRRILIGENDELLLSGLDIIFIESTKDEYIPVIGPYTAPEQTRGTVLPASDQYALAAIVYEWLSGQPPLAFSSSENVADKALRLASTPPTPLRPLVPELPQKVEDVVMKALAKDPKQRFPSVEDFVRALEEASMPKSEPKMPDRVGQTFGDYRLIKLLGRGGFADVYLGQHTLMGTYAAVKVLHAQLMGEYAERFRNEARTIANLKHPQIVRVLGFGVEGETPFLVMDQAKETLRDRHPQGSVLPPKVILPYVKQVAAALQHAHNQRLIHRDIKPENMLIGPRNEVLLSDFGIATVVHQTSVKNTQSIAGTAIYMAPEQFRSRIHIASDQYSLGIVVYEWLCGQPPFTEGDFIQLGFQHNSDPPPSLRGRVPSLSPDIERVVMIALAKDPTQRFASIQAFANALEQACK